MGAGKYLIRALIAYSLLAHSPIAFAQKNSLPDPLGCMTNISMGHEITGYKGNLDKMLEDAQQLEKAGNYLRIWTQSLRANCLYRVLGNEKGAEKTAKDYRCNNPFGEKPKNYGDCP